MVGPPTSDPSYARPRAHDPQYPSTLETKEDWVSLAATSLVLGGILSIIWGLVALRKGDFFDESSLIWKNLTAWGWFSLVLGVLQFVGASLVNKKSAHARLVAIVVSILAILIGFLSLDARPVWSIIALIVSAIVLWAATVHGPELR
jgi:hypothetical protein